MATLRIALAFTLFSAAAFGLDGFAYQAFYSSFAPFNCCWSSRCCWAIAPQEVEDLGGGIFRIVASSQIVPRTGYSPDGRYHRCACDRQPDFSTWQVWPGARTRCLFTPRHAS